MNKKVVITFVVFFVLVLIIGMFVLLNRNSESPCKSIDENGYCILKDVPEYLKFQEPVAIDEHELYNFSKSPVSEYFVEKDPTNFSKGLLCADADTPYEYKTIYYFVKDCEQPGTQCPYRRAAVICDTFYIVEDHDITGYGLTQYGPYDL